MAPMRGRQGDGTTGRQQKESFPCMKSPKIGERKSLHSAISVRWKGNGSGRRGNCGCHLQYCHTVRGKRSMSGLDALEVVGGDSYFISREADLLCRSFARHSCHWHVKMGAKKKWQGARVGGVWNACGSLVVFSSGYLGCVGGLPHPNGWLPSPWEGPKKCRG